MAVTRQTWEETPPGGWLPEQRIPVAQAVEAYTLGAAYAGHREKTEGSITPGKLADLILVSQNIFVVEPHTIRKTEVLLTMVGGKVVYRSPQWPPAPAQKPERTPPGTSHRLVTSDTYAMAPLPVY